MTKLGSFYLNWADFDAKSYGMGWFYIWRPHSLSLLASGQYSISLWPLGDRHELENQVRCSSIRVTSWRSTIEGTKELGVSVR